MPLYGLIAAYGAYFAYCRFSLLTFAPALLCQSVLFAAVLLVTDGAVLQVVHNLPPPIAVLVQAHDATALEFRAPRFFVWRFKFQQRRAHLLKSQSDLIGYGSRVDVNMAGRVGVRNEVCEDQKPVRVAAKRPLVDARKKFCVHLNPRKPTALIVILRSGHVNAPAP